MNAQQIAEQLGNAKKEPKGFLASCPVPSHGRGNGDKNPSLSICDTDTDAKVLFKCFGGCSQESVFNAIKDMGLLPELPKMEDIFKDVKPLALASLQRQDNHSFTPVVEAEWFYTDEMGENLFVKRRLRVNTPKGKDYRLYRIENGVVQHTLGNARIVPYSLPAVQDAIERGRAVYIVEGEKCAESVKGLGLVSTTSHRGASGWPKEINQFFVDANVIVLPDNDRAGEGYSKSVVENLFGVAKSIRVVELPSLEEREDVYDWIHKYGHTKEELIELAKDAKKITDLDEYLWNSAFETPNKDALGMDSLASPSESESSVLAPKRYKLEAWDEIKDEPVEWLIDGVLPRRSFAALFGAPGSYKSFVALDIAEAVATGRDWMDRSVNNDNDSAVLYIAGEGHGGIGARIKACKQHNQTPDGAQIYVIRSQINMRSSLADMEALVASVDELVAEHGIKLELIIVDTLARSMGGNANENSSEDMGAIINNLGAIQARYDSSLLVVHHSGKDATKGMRGHSSLLGAVDTELEITKILGKDERQGTILIRKQKDGEDGLTLGFKCVEVNLGDSLELLESSSLAIQMDETVNSMTEESAKGRKKSNRLGKGPNNELGFEVLNVLLKEHKIRETINGKTVYCVDLSAWKRDFDKRKGGFGTPKLLDQAFDRVCTALQNASLVEIWGDKVWSKSGGFDSNEF
jgi:hypothetical protein